MSKTINTPLEPYELVWKSLTRGVTDKLEQEGNVIDRWSPNNLRRLIVSPEGVVLQYFTKKGSFVKSIVDIVPFQVDNFQSYKRPITTILHKDRVFTSIEEIIIIPRSIRVDYTLSQDELQRVQNKLTSFKRLGYVHVVTQVVSLEDFLKTHLEQLKDPYTLLGDTGVDGATSIKVNDKWYNHTSLRPQFYTMDEEGRELHKYFQDVRDYHRNKVQGVGNAKSKETDKNESTSTITGKTKKLLLHHLHQMGKITQPTTQPNRQGWFTKVGVAQIPVQKKYKDSKDSKTNQALQSLGMYSDKGVEDNDLLQKDVSNRILQTSVHLVTQLGKSSPLLSDKLKGVLGRTFKEGTNLEEIATLGYRPTFKEKLLEGVVKQEDIETIKNSLKDTSTSKIQGVVDCILFDLGYQPSDVVYLESSGDLVTEIAGLDGIVYHDLAVHFNNLNNRPYNSLLKQTETYVDDQPIGERLTYIANKLQEGVVDEETEKVKQLYDTFKQNLDKGLLKQKFEGGKTVLANSLDNQPSKIESESVFKHTYSIINKLSNLRETRIAMAHELIKQGSRLETKLGTNGVVTDVGKEILDPSKPYETEYSKYVELLIDMLFNHK